MQPRGSTRPSVSKSSCTIAHHPTENGEAEPQSMERKRIHSLGTSNGLMTCRPLSQQSKNAPKVTDQSPSSHADTSSLLPEARNRCLYASSVDVNVIVDLGWDEYPLQTGHIVPDDYIAQRCRIDVASSDPLVSWPARIPCRAEPDRHARGRSERRHHLHHPRRPPQCTTFPH